MTGRLLCCAALLFSCVIVPAQTPAKPGEQKLVVQGKPEPAAAVAPADSTTDGAVTVGGQRIAYKAVAGTLTVGYSDAFDAMLGLDGKLLPDSGMNPPDAAKPEEAPATARMFYTGYFKNEPAAGPAGSARPVIFFYNGGPGSATMWLHMGSFGPRRVVTPDTEHQTAAPYSWTWRTWCLSTRRGRGSAASTARTGRRRSGVWTRMRTRSTGLSGGS